MIQIQGMEYTADEDVSTLAWANALADASLEVKDIFVEAATAVQQRIETVAKTAGGLLVQAVDKLAS